MSSYILRDINAPLWDQVKEKAQREKAHPKDIIEDQLRIWLNGGIDAERMRKEWAWEHAAEVYKERDLLVRALSMLYPSHLMYRKGHQPAAGNPRKVVVCIHAPTGQMAWTIPETMRKSYGHLEITENDWDGHKTAIRTARLTDLGASRPSCTPYGCSLRIDEPGHLSSCPHGGQGHKKEKP